MDFYFQFAICLVASLGAGWIFHLVSAWLNTICHFCNIDNWPIFKRLTSILEELRILNFFFPRLTVSSPRICLTIDYPHTVRGKRERFYGKLRFFQNWERTERSSEEMINHLRSIHTIHSNILYCNIMSNILFDNNILHCIKYLTDKKSGQQFWRSYEVE